MIYFSTFFQTSITSSLILQDTADFEILRIVLDYYGFIDLFLIHNKDFYGFFVKIPITD